MMSINSFNNTIKSHIAKKLHIVKYSYIGSMFFFGFYNNWKLTKNDTYGIYSSKKDLLFFEKVHINLLNLIFSFMNGVIYVYYPITIWYLCLRAEMYHKNIEINDDNIYYWNEYFAEYEKKKK